MSFLFSVVLPKKQGFAAARTQDLSPCERDNHYTTEIYILIESDTVWVCTIYLNVFMEKC